MCTRARLHELAVSIVGDSLWRWERVRQSLVKMDVFPWTRVGLTTGLLRDEVEPSRFDEGPWDARYARCVVVDRSGGMAW